MQIPWTDQKDIHHYSGHNQLAHIIADITGRTVIIVFTVQDKFEEKVFIFKPGFATKFGDLPSSRELEHLAVSI